VIPAHGSGDGDGDGDGDCDGEEPSASLMVPIGSFGPLPQPANERHNRIAKEYRIGLPS
jgi:hypothetical protein